MCRMVLVIYKSKCMPHATVTNNMGIMGTFSKTTEACKVTQKGIFVFKPHDKIPMFSVNTFKS